MQCCVCRAVLEEKFPFLLCCKGNAIDKGGDDDDDDEPSGTSKVNQLHTVNSNTSHRYVKFML